MGRPIAGAVLRSSPISARLLSQLRVRQLKRAGATGELRAFAKYCRRGTVAVDVGASVGVFTLAASNAVGRHGHVYALEPNPQVFSELINTSWGTRITALNIAASNHRGNATFAVPLDSKGSQSPPLGSLEIRPASQSDEFIVRTILLDDIVPPTSEVSAIKIDVEGHELRVMEGAIETIERCHPALVVEIEERHLTDTSVHRVVEWTRSLGYDVWGISGLRMVPWSDFDLYEWQGKWLDGDSITDQTRYVNNFLFLPAKPQG